MWLWEKLLEHGSAAVPYHPEASMQWACLAATASEKHDLAVAMLMNSDVKRALVHLADDDELLPSWETSGSDDRVGAHGGAEVPPPAAPPGGADSSSSEWWREASADDLEVAYARLALHRLAQTAALSDSSDLSAEEIADRQEPFTRRYLQYSSPPLPSRPPPRTLAPPDYEKLAATIASVMYCGLGGLLWGGLAGWAPSQRARRPVWRSALLSAAGAVLFEGAMQTKLAAFYRARALGASSGAAPQAVRSSSGGAFGGGGGGPVQGWGGGSGGQRFGGGVAPVPLYGSLRGLVSGVSLDLALSSAILLAIVQPRRAPLAFGGWAIGRLACLSQEVEVGFSGDGYIDEE